MTNEITSESERIIYLYCVTCLVNNKNYIGQTVDPDSRWRAHRKDSGEPKVPFHFAIKKHGAENFEFKIIATCKGQDNANELETLLVKQYDSFVTNGKGYNATHGGSNAPKSEEWKEALRKWRSSLSEEEKETIKKKQSEATFNQIATNGHPGEGKKRTPEQSARLSQARKDHPVNYTPEIRKKMSDSHIGKEQPPELIAKRVESIKIVTAARKKKKIESGELKCNAPNCDIDPADIKKYRILNGVRYCAMHALRLKNTGFLDLQPQSSHNLGKTAPNRIQFTEEQTLSILADKRPLEQIARDFKVTAKVIVRVKKEGKYLTTEEIMKNGK